MKNKGLGFVRSVYGETKETEEEKWLLNLIMNLIQA